MLRHLRHIYTWCAIPRLDSVYLRLLLAAWALGAIYLLWLGIRPTPLPLHDPYDKLLHGGACAFLLILPAILCRNFRAVLLVAASVILAGIALEFYQMLLPAREVSVHDVLANTAGVIIGTILGRLMHRRLTR